MFDSFAIKKKMFEKGISQRKLAKLSGRSLTYINDTINNKRDANVEDIKMFCDVLSISDPLEKCSIFLA